MGNRSFVAALLLASAMANPAGAGTLDRSLEGNLRSGEDVRVIVTFKSSVAKGRPAADRGAAISAFQSEARRSQAGTLSFIEGRRAASSADVRSLWIANALVVTASPDLVRALAARSDVESVFANEQIELEPARVDPIPRREADVLERGPRAPGDTAEYTYGLLKVKVPELRQVYNLTGEGVKMGIIDTGIDASHPDLQGKTVAWKDFVNSKPDPYDDQGHGSHVAGTIAGGNASGLSIGIAPKAKLMVGKVFTASGTAATEHILAAMQWIADPDGNPATNDQPSLCSNSWGGGPGRKVFLEATRKWVTVGVFPSFAAGNSGPGAGTVGTPGGFLEAFAVGATDNTDAIADFSSRGPVTWDEKQYTKPDISAPGKAITSVKAGGGYTAMSGTSMATPHISGILALLYQANPGMSIDQARDLLERTAEDKGEPGKDNTFGAGRSNAFAAAQILVSGGKIAGKLTDSESGAALRGVVSVAENGFAVKTDANGRFSMVLPAGSYTLAARSFGYTEQTGLAVQLGAQQSATVDIKLARAASGTLAGRVLSAETNEPLNARITVLDTPLDPVSTAASGDFSLSLPAGNYRVLVSAFGYDSLTVNDVTVGAGGTVVQTFKLTHLPAILVVADDANKGYEKYVKGALDSLAKKYSVINAAQSPSTLTGEFLRQYQVVVWMTGDNYSETLTATDQANLKAFVENGGSLFATGQDIGYDIKEGEFYGQVLHAKWVADSAATKDVTGSGLTFKIDGGTGASNQRYADKVQGLNGATTLLEYAGGNGPAALASTFGHGKSVYFAFGFEGIDSEASRQAVLTAVLAYLAPTAAERARQVARTAPGQVLAAQTHTLATDIRAMDAAALDDLKTALAQGLKVPRDVRRSLNARLLEQAAR